MAKLSGTEILALARIHAQDNDSASNYAVGAADALLLLNNILVENAAHFGAKAKYIGGTESGLAFSAGDSSAVADGDPTFMEIVSAHPSNSGALTFPVSPPLRRIGVDQLQDLLAYDGDNALSQQAREWECFAAERTEDMGVATTVIEEWRIWVYPVLTRTRYLTLKVIPATTISNIAHYPDLDEGDARIVARLLGWELARLKKESTPQFLDSILAPLPKELRERSYRGGVNALQLPSAVEWRDW